jgi:hypothetical protein
MDFLSLLFLMALIVLGWFWLNSIRVLEIARDAGNQACVKANVQFLDDTVSRVDIALARNWSGRRVLRRTYRFEFSETGNTRLEGKVIMLGETVESVTMDAYQML